MKERKKKNERCLGPLNKVSQKNRCSLVGVRSQKLTDSVKSMHIKSGVYKWSAGWGTEKPKATLLYIENVKAFILARIHRLIKTGPNWICQLLEKSIFRLARERSESHLSWRTFACVIVFTVLLPGSNTHFIFMTWNSTTDSSSFSLSLAWNTWLPAAAVREASSNVLCFLPLSGAKVKSVCPTLFLQKKTQLFSQPDTEKNQLSTRIPKLTFWLSN